MLSCGDPRRPERTREEMPAWTAPKSTVAAIVAHAGPKSASRPSRTQPPARKNQYQGGTLISAMTCWRRRSMELRAKWASDSPIGTVMGTPHFPTGKAYNFPGRKVNGHSEKEGATG